ncbi:MAG: hypothetical protein ABIP97_00235, partial [Chthoniobacterales bacterium]
HSDMFRPCLPLLLAGGIIALSLTAYGDVEKLEAQRKLAAGAEDNYSEIELLRRLLDEKPKDDAAHQRLIELWMKTTDYTMAEAALAQWSNAPKPLAARVHAKILYSRDENLSTAIQTLNTALKDSPNDVQTLEDLSNYLAIAKEWNAQVKVYDTLLSVKQTPQRFLDRAQAKRLSGDYTSAISDARAAQALEPDNLSVKKALPGYERLAIALNASARLTPQIRAHPNDLKSLLLRASFYQYADMSDLALLDAETALKLSPNSVYAKIIQARMLCALSKITSTVANEEYKVEVSKPRETDATRTGLINCDLILANTPNNPKALQERAYWLNDEIAQYALAADDAKAALKIDPKFTPASLEIIYALAMSGKTDEALVYLHRLEELNPSKKTLAQAFATFANTYFKKSDFVLALDFAGQSLKQDETAPMLRLKASCLQRLGRQKEADTALKRVKELKGKK